MSIYGGGSTLFFLTDGKLMGIGYNNCFELGQGHRDGPLTAAVEIKIPGNPRILRFSVGIEASATVVLTTNGLYGCGDGTSGEFGDGEEEFETMDAGYRPTMKVLQCYQDKLIEKYFCEGFSLWVLVKGRKVFRNGDNSFGTLANGTDDEIFTPEELDKSFFTSKKESVVDIKSHMHTVLLTDKGRVYSCGAGKYGRRGMGENDCGEKWNFERVSFFEKRKECVLQIAIGQLHSLFVTANNATYSCGNGTVGATGRNDKGNKYVPTALDSLKSEKIVKIVCGTLFSMFLTRHSVVFGCGDNRHSQLTKLKGEKNVYVPTKISSSLVVVDIAATCRSAIVVFNVGWRHVFGWLQPIWTMLCWAYVGSRGPHEVNHQDSDDERVEDVVSRETNKTCGRYCGSWINGLAESLRERL